MCCLRESDVGYLVDEHPRLCGMEMETTFLFALV